MLTDEQRLQLSERVLTWIGMGPDATLFTELAGASVVRLAPAGINGARVADWLLRFALSRPDPLLFIKIVREASGGMYPELHSLADQLEADPTRWGGPAGDELWVPDPPRRPFIDRAELRQVLIGMAQGTGPGAIIIDAPDGQGKRTVCDFIRQFAGRTESFSAVVERELRAERERGLLDRIVFDLRDALRLGLALDTTHVEPERIGKVMATDLVRDVLLSPPGPMVWLVVNLVDPDVEEELVRFLDELLSLVQGDSGLADRMRLVLLTDKFSRFTLEHIPPPEHRHALPDVDDAAIREWFAATVPGRLPAQYGLATEGVLLNLTRRNPAPAQRLVWLARIADVTHRQLAALP